VCQPQEWAALKKQAKPQQSALLAVFALLAIAVCMLSFEPLSFYLFQVLIELYFSTLVKRVLMVFNFYKPMI
jgi:hypothetical protein